MKQKSVGRVLTKQFAIEDDLKLSSGKTLSNVELAYETYGELNSAKSNAILVCHALTGDAHAAGVFTGNQNEKPGWWDMVIGPGKALDTDKYFVICSNVLGGCKGSTGPASINPKTGKEYALDFPIITIEDMVHAQKKLIEFLGIEKLYAVIGGSMGGMQALQWTVSYPKMMKKASIIATTARSSPQQIAFNEVGRQSIILDNNWNKGNYYDQEKSPRSGLAVARMIGHITYLSDESMYQKFGRDLQDKKELSYDFTVDFEVESYLHHQGETFVRRFDANSYLYITKAVDYFDLAIEGNLAEGLKGVESKIQIIAVDSDWLYPVDQSKDLLAALQSNDVDVIYNEVKSSYGHDAFLLENGQMNFLLSNFLSEHNVGDVMKTDVPTINIGSSVKEAAVIMFDREITHLPVVNEDNSLAGIVTAWDLSKSIVEDCTELREVMTKDVRTCKPTDEIEDIARLMKKYNISCLPVVEGSNLKGLITTDRISHLISNY
ncbi:homoserine O-acetyltransferase [Methanobrevibacter sp.]|uniref:homoserine O-acetyltransferase MetX n=1 Tax=Methanobrevibacter sp. TaxID=66852 RepID=UPI0025EA0345|nr:homoserine O-acetyltransferase [Methanobrevibacter sp.]MBQ2961335.1 homoserine O-acetyltransferase [Methanobrevibacter sp.]